MLLLPVLIVGELINPKHLQAAVRVEAKHTLTDTLHPQEPIPVRRHHVFQDRLGAAVRQDPLEIKEQVRPE